MYCSLKRKEESEWKNVKAKFYISTKADFRRGKWTCANGLLEKSKVLHSKTIQGNLSCILWDVYVTIQNNKIPTSRVISRSFSFPMLFDSQQGYRAGILSLLHLILSYIPCTQPSSGSRFNGSRKWSMRLLSNRVVLIKNKQTKTKKTTKHV